MISEYFWMRLTLNWCGWQSRLSAPVWVSIVQSDESLKRTEEEEGICLLLFFLPACLLELEHWSSPAFGLEFIPLTSLVLRPLDLGWNYTTTFLDLQLVDGSQFPLVNQSASLPISVSIYLPTFLPSPSPEDPRLI